MKTLVTEKQNLKDLHRVCLFNNIPFVSYKPPQHIGTKTLLQTGSYPKKLSTLRELTNISGFIITPFFNKLQNTSFFLEPDIVVTDLEIDKKLLSGLDKIKLFNSIEYLNGKGIYEARMDEFTRQVKIVQQHIANGNIKKAVLSRVHIEPKSNSFDISQLFLELCDKYPNAFVYVFQIPRAGCWIGATPEPLLLVKDNIVETISLAGTQRLGEIPLDEIKWPLKELEEQDIVTQYIENVLVNNNITDFKKTGPFSQKAGNLAHLKTSFLFNASRIGNRLGEFVEMLHPTPSICGFPKDEVFELLKDIEHHHREYYTGLLGPVNMDNDTSLYVNLRCMKVIENKLALFLGAGITSGSVPESEWEETNQKKMTLLSVVEKLNNIHNLI